MSEHRNVSGTNTRNTACLTERQGLVGIQALAAFDTHGGHLHIVEVFGQAHGFHLLLVVDFTGLSVEEACVDFFGIHIPLIAARKIQVGHGSLEKLVHEVAATPVAAAPQQPRHMQPPTSFGYKIVNGQAYILSYTGDERDMVIPETIEGAPVTMIEARAFENDSSIERVVLPQSLQIIRKYAFRGCVNLRKLDIPDNSNLKTIGECAFENCERLIGTADSLSQKRLVLPNGIQSINRWAFAQCQSLQTVVIPESIQTIGFGAFSECTSLDKLWLPHGAQNRLGRLDLIVDRLNCLQWGAPAD